MVLVAQGGKAYNISSGIVSQSCGLGRRAWIDIAINAATAAENRPVYDK